MGNRLSKIYTRTGDQGDTGLADGIRVDKDCARIEAIGTIDELNSALGLLLAQAIENDLLRNALTEAQHELFDLGGELSMPGHTLIEARHIERLERALDTVNADLPPLKEFILPGGNQAAACAHLARAICRRAERRTVTLTRQEHVNPCAIAYLNRLSDLLFVCARILARADGGEVLWRHER